MRKVLLQRQQFKDLTVTKKTSHEKMVQKMEGLLWWKQQAQLSISLNLRFSRRRETITQYTCSHDEEMVAMNLALDARE